jgi:hypothetical protein
MRIGGSKRTGNRWARKSRFSVPTNGTAASIAIQALQSLLYICIGGDSFICTTRVSSAWRQAPLRDKRSPRNTPFHIDGIPCHVHKVDNDVDHKLYNRQSDCDANRNGHHTFHNAPSRCILCKTFLHKHRNALFVPGSLIVTTFLAAIATCWNFIAGRTKVQATDATKTAIVAVTAQHTAMATPSLYTICTYRYATLLAELILIRITTRESITFSTGTAMLATVAVATSTCPTRGVLHSAQKSSHNTRAHSSDSWYVYNRSFYIVDNE